MTTRQFIRTRTAIHVTPAEVAIALVEALEANGTVEILDEVGPAPDRLAFTLHAQGHGVIARAPDGQHLGTFGDALISVQHAFALLDRAAQEQPASRPKCRQSTRGTTTGEYR